MGALEDRLEVLRGELRQRGRITTTEASLRLGVTPVTLRRDIVALEQEGVAIRVHGGAIAPTGHSFEPPLAERLKRNTALKTAMAQQARTHLRPGMNVALDFGTRILALADVLRRDPISLTIAPSSIEAARILAADPHYRVMTPEGWVEPGDLNISGNDAHAFFARHRWDVCVLTVTGIDIDTLLLSDLKPEYAAIKRAMYEASDQALILLEPGHIGTRTFAPVTTARPGDVVIASEQSPQAALRALGASGLVIETVAESRRT